MQTEPADLTAGFFWLFLKTKTLPFLIEGSSIPELNLAHVSTSKQLIYRIELWS